MTEQWDDPNIPSEQRLTALEETVLEYTLPPYKYTKTRIAKDIGRSPSTVWRIQQDLVKKGKLDRTPSGHIFKGKYEHATKVYQEIENKTFRETPTVKKWVENMKARNIIDYKRRVTNLWKLCKTIDTNPIELLQNINIVQSYWDQFVNKFREGDAFSIRNENNKAGGINPKHYGDALKSYRSSNGKEIPRGYIETKQPNTATYARIKLSDLDKQKGIKFFREKYGQELTDIFILDNEFGPRAYTLFTMEPTFEKHYTQIDGHDCEYYRCLIYERKQHITYEKPIITPEAREVAQRLPSGKQIHSSLNIDKIKTEYNAALRDLFVFLGKISPDKKDWESYTPGTEQWYYVNDPTHAIRHSCIHWLMRITGMRAETVSSFFWEKPETLDIYSKTTLEEIFEQHLCNYCNPPKTTEQSSVRFCSFPHALVWYNYAKSKAEMSQM